ncbi:MAG: hypothetical protein ACO1NM_00315 [Sphingobium phenoxybenzoativorans]|uniref:Uncharacterized protein n=1 Tax=Sphingobium phenoxybenzoativorans TaxID=1592790 RepID=A0A975K9J7_9SPHN|nr:hypothetical protein [Sphingobium phenoxybenzoativorans]QUT05932.1 hypothetical protein KFK14_23885 [Sphingobium phenoxybenzoativorans]
MASMFNQRTAGSGRNYMKRMSTHTAGALVVFALLQIFVVAKMGGSLVLHLGIIVAIGGFALAARSLEHRWTALERSGLSDDGLATRFRVDLLQLWAASLLAPMLWIPVAIVGKFVFG